MANAAKPLDAQQRALIEIIRAAHRNLAIARRTKVSETNRRIAESKIELTRMIDEGAARIRVEMDAELEKHATALDESLIVAYNNNVPIRRIAIDAFGSRYDGTVTALITALRNDGRLGVRVGHQGSKDGATEVVTSTTFPSLLEVEEPLNSALEVQDPKFVPLLEMLELVPAGEDGNDGISVHAVELHLDYRDSWFKKIAKNPRAGTEYLSATFCTLYLHPATGELVAYESKETGDTIWDHPVARWVKSHPEEARKGYDAAVA